MQLKNEGESIAFCPSEVTRTPQRDKVFKSINMSSPTIDMHIIPMSPCFSTERICVVKPIFSSSSITVEKITTKKSFVSEKGPRQNPI